MSLIKRTKPDSVILASLVLKYCKFRPDIKCKNDGSEKAAASNAIIALSNGLWVPVLASTSFDRFALASKHSALWTLQ